MDVLSRIPLDGLLAAHRAARDGSVGRVVASLAVQGRDTRRRLLCDDDGLMGWENRERDGTVLASERVREPAGTLRHWSFTGIHVIEPAVLDLAERTGSFSIVSWYLDLARRGYRVLGGLICLFDPQSRVLLSNDHLLRDISSNPVVEPDPNGGPRPHRLVQSIQHMQRVADLEPSVAWTGHGHEIHDVHKTVRQRLHFHERRAQRILDLIGAEERSAYQITEPLFGRLDGIDSFLALSETIGHLDWLEEQGRIAAVRRGEAIYWRKSCGHG